MKKKILKNNYLYILAFIIPIFVLIFLFMKNDSDLWYLLAEGREIVKNGLYSFDKLSMHTDFAVTIQNWLSASTFYIIYSLLGTKGIFIFIILLNSIICLLFYKICMLLSNNNKVLSLPLMVINDLLLCSCFIVTRPQVISYIFLLLTIYLQELYIKNNNSKYLKFLPIISILLINFHASVWWMMFLFILPYLIDAFNIPILKTQKYNKKPLFIWTIIAFVAGFLNPYTYKAITFIFTSFTDNLMHLYINELHPFSFNRGICYLMFAVMLALVIIYYLYRNGKTRLRYICLFSGTLILSFISIKGFSNFLLVSIFPLAYFFKDIIPNNLDFINDNFQKIINILITMLCILLIILIPLLFIKNENKLELKHEADNALKVLEQYSKETSTVYTSFNNGGYVEFYGYKAYIDPRAEVFLKVNNKKADVFEENYNLQKGKVDINEFLNKYQFTHLLVHKGDVLFDLNNSNYVLIYNDDNYQLYVRDVL